MINLFKIIWFSLEQIIDLGNATIVHVWRLLERVVALILSLFARFDARQQDRKATFKNEQSAKSFDNNGKVRMSLKLPGITGKALLLYFLFHYSLLLAC